jgi:hypothetical protein
MRPTEDLAVRARNWFWYWQVRGMAELSNDRLDEKFLGAGRGRARHFERIQQTASSPDKMALSDGKTLLDLVHSHTEPGADNPHPYTEARATFQSGLWEFLSRRDIAPDGYTDFVQRYVNERGWFRASNRDDRLILMFLGETEPAVEPGASTACSAMLHKIADEATPDAVAVLVALFREALSNVQLEQAILIKSALRTSVHWTCERYAIPAPVSTLLRRLVDDRIISNIWVSEDDWRTETQSTRRKGNATRERIKDFQACVAWYIGRSFQSQAGQYGMYSIVPRSARIDWFVKNQDMLAEAYREILELRRYSWERERLPRPESRLHGEVAAEDAKAILEAIALPEGEPERFYSELPQRQMGQLPPAVEAHPIRRATLNAHTNGLDQPDQNA